MMFNKEIAKEWKNDETGKRVKYYDKEPKAD